MMSFLSSDIARLNALISILGLVRTIGKYLPLIVGAFVLFNLVLAIISFVLWNNIALGVLNSIFSLGGFIFLGQLIRRRNIHRYDYRYKGRHTLKPTTSDAKTGSHSDTASA
jgi:hypothetical protein